MPARRFSVSRDLASLRSLGVAFMALAAGCTFSPQLPSGKVTCTGTVKDECPDETPVCLQGFCRRRDEIPGTDGAAGGGGVGGATRAGGAGGGVSPGSGGAGGSAAPDGSTLPDAPPNPDALARPDVAIDRPVETPLPVDAKPDAVVDVRPPIEAPPPVPSDWIECVPPAAPNLAMGLIAHLKLDETGTNPLLADSSPNKVGVTAANLGTGAGWHVGRRGGALSLAGGATGGWVAVGGTPVAPVVSSISDGLSVSAWVKFPPGKPADGVLLSRQAAGPRGYLYRFSVFNGGLRAQIHTTNGSRADVFSNPPLPVDGRWMHVVMTYGIKPGVGVEVFVNGQSFGADHRYGLQIGPENTPVVVGAAEDPATLPVMTIIDRLKGSLDEVSLYDRPLTVVEVQALACGASPVP